MQLSTKLRYHASNIGASVADVLVLALAGLGSAFIAGGVVWAMWHGGWLRWLAVGAVAVALIVCTVVVMAALVVGKRADERKGAE